MRRIGITFSTLCLAVCARAASAQGASTLPSNTAASIDRIFAPMAKPGSPGCAVGVYENGAVVFAKGYGYANLTDNVPITAETRFTVGSVSKQFTAASIALLVRAGRISLADDVRKYIPELHDYGTPVTIGHLVHHTSGVRDFWELVDLAGMRPDDGYTSDDMLDLAQHQKGLNFTPGAEYRYSNTGYLLLGIVVKRVTGQSLRRFADSAIFKPLAMKNTLFLDDHNEIVPRRAMAYEPAKDGWRIDVWNNDIVGQGGVVTSIADLQRWDENFYTGRLGGPEFVKLVQTTEPLNDGKPNKYAFGLEVGNYRGLPLVSHTGSTGGYRAAIFRFPEQHATVSMLCNGSTANTTQLSHAMADAVLDGRFKPDAWTEGYPTPARDATPIYHAGDPEVIRTLPGRYRSDELLGAEWTISNSNGFAVTVSRPRHAPEEFRADSLKRFTSRGVSLSFDPPVNGKSPGFTVNGSRVQGLRFERVP